MYTSEVSVLPHLTGSGCCKGLFIDLGLFPEDQRIAVAASLDMWAELYEGSADKVSMANLYELTISNLAGLVVTRHGNFTFITNLLL
ncbi:unnamed protein product [Malus baccata var. baccata]|uniref:Uncharacterized protein n=1 Tax=Malus domestica TaxID=3750 RepID=A0A498KHM4_MALDO|nr:hypothetical protein DVH24_026334 [Malus domestica]